MKLGQFLFVPFLAIYLSYYALPPLLVGIIIASGQLSHSITSLFTGIYQIGTVLKSCS